MRKILTSEVFRQTLFFIPLVLLVVVILLRVFAINILNAVAREDKLFENIQSFMYLTASALIFTMAKNKFRGKLKNGFFWVYILAGFSLLFWGLEEISWGQRIFNWETEGVFEEHNIQGETTIHNMGIVGMAIDYIHLFITGTALLVIYFRDKLVSNRYLRYFSDFFPQQKQALYFLIPFVVFLLYLTVRYWGWFWWTSSLDTRELETAELMISAGIFWIVFDKFMETRRKQD